MQFYTCDILDDNQNTYMVGGLQDNGTLFYDGGDLDINDMISGEMVLLFFDDNDPLLITSTYYNAWYFFNLDNNSVEYGNGNSGVFINPSDYDSDNNILYANKVRFNGSQSNRIIKLTNIENDPNITTINLGTTSPVYFSLLSYLLLIQIHYILARNLVDFINQSILMDSQVHSILVMMISYS